jgi:peptidoglycan/LPS O-acetylase OafA/YrhL
MLIPWLCTLRVNVALSPIGRAAGLVASASYTIYLTHFPIMCALDRVFPKGKALTAQSIGDFFARIAICLLCSAAMYWLFERNTETVRHWLRSERTAVDAAQLAPAE